MKTYKFTNGEHDHSVIAINHEAAWEKLADKLKEKTSCKLRGKGWKLSGTHQ